MPNRQRKVRFPFRRCEQNSIYGLDEGFWRAMLSYYSYRITDIVKYANKVGKRLDAIESKMNMDALTELSKHCSRSPFATTEGGELLVNLALQIRNSDLVTHLLAYAFGLSGRKLGLLVSSLASIRETFQTFKIFRNSIRGKRFSVVPIPLPPQKSR